MRCIKKEAEILEKLGVHQNVIRFRHVSLSIDKVRLKNSLITLSSPSKTLMVGLLLTSLKEGVPLALAMAGTVQTGVALP